MAYAPDGLEVVFPDLSSSCIDDGIRIITLQTQAQNFVTVAAEGGGIAVMPSGNSALMTGGILGSFISRMNLQTTAVTPIPDTSSTFGVAVTPDSSQAIVASGGGDTVKRIDLSTNTVVGATPYSSNSATHNVAITPDGYQAIAVGDFDTALIDIATDTVVASYPNGGNSVAISPDGKSAYISVYTSGNVVVLHVIRIPPPNEIFNGGFEPVPTVVYFGLGADDYGALTIGGVAVCTYNYTPAAGGCNGAVSMLPGIWYDIAIDYKNREGTDGLALSWSQADGPASLGYGFGGAYPNLVPLTSLRTLNAGSSYVSGLRGDYYDLSGNFQSTVFGEGPIDAINNVYNNQIAGSWNGYGYSSLFEERLSGQIQVSGGH